MRASARVRLRSSETCSPVASRTVIMAWSRRPVQVPRSGAARTFMSGARSAAAALARDLGNAQQQFAAVHGSEPAEEAGESGREQAR
jgi:hypothetical protein